MSLKSIVVLKAGVVVGKGCLCACCFVVCMIDKS